MQMSMCRPSFVIGCASPHPLDGQLSDWFLDLFKRSQAADCLSNTGVCDCVYVVICV